METPKEILFFTPSGVSVVNDPNGSDHLAMFVYLSEREKLFLKLPDNREIALLMSRDEATRLAHRLLERAASEKK